MIPTSGKQRKRVLMNCEFRTDEEFIKCFNKLPERIKNTARKNYSLWKQSPKHPSLEFKKIYSNKEIYSIRVAIGWRALGSKKDNDTIVWFWIGSHSQYNSILQRIINPINYFPPVKILFIT